MARLAGLIGQYIRVALGIIDYRYMVIEIGYKIRGLMIRQAKAGIVGSIGGIGGMEDSRLEDKLIGKAYRDRLTECIWDLAAIYGSSIILQHYMLDIWYPAKLLL